MKQRILLLSFSLFFFGLQAQDIPEKQTPLISKRTATWCGPCGTWGWNFFENVYEDNKEDAVLIGMHFSGDLTTTVAQDITNNFTAFGQPRFYVGNEDQNVSSSNAATKRTEVRDLVTSMNAEAPIVNTGMNAFMVDGVITVNTKTRFFQEAEGTYYQGLYIVENNVMNTQSGQSGVVPHENVMRASFTGTSFGEPISQMTNFEVNATFENTFSIDMNNNWEESNLIIVSIIWKKDGDNYQFVNANQTTDFFLTNIEEISELDLFQVFPTIANSTATAKIVLTENLNTTSLNLYDLNGRIIKNIFTGDLTTGEHYFDVAPSTIATKGMYVLTLESGDKKVSQRLVVQ